MDFTFIKSKAATEMLFESFDSEWLSGVSLLGETGTSLAHPPTNKTKAKDKMNKISIFFIESILKKGEYAGLYGFLKEKKVTFINRSCFSLSTSSKTRGFEI